MEITNALYYPNVKSGFPNLCWISVWYFHGIYHGYIIWVAWTELSKLRWKNILLQEEFKTVLRRFTLAFSILKTFMFKIKNLYTYSGKSLEMFEPLVCNLVLCTKNKEELIEAKAENQEMWSRWRIPGLSGGLGLAWGDNLKVEIIHRSRRMIHTIIMVSLGTLVNWYFMKS